MIKLLWTLCFAIVIAADGEKYSSFYCMGGSQVMNTESMHQSVFKKFPLNDPEHRVCVFRNMCIVNGSLTFYESPRTHESLPAEYLPEGFDGNMYHTAHLRGFTLPIKTVVGQIPSTHTLHHSKLAFLDANSWSYNYGHYMIDNVLTSFTGAQVMNIPFEGTQQVFETKCRQFSILEVGFSNKIVDFNHSMGTYQQACLEKFANWPVFYSNPPMYMDEMGTQSTCFRKLMAGQASCFSLKSLVLSRAVLMRGLRDFVLKRMIANKVDLPAQEDLVLVGLRVPGCAGGAIIGNLCEMVQKAVEDTKDRVSKTYKVLCVVPSDYSLQEEIRLAQRAKVIITVHGTISYLSLFTREGTQQISIASPKEYKENQILMWSTHSHLLYLPWDRLSEITSVVERALTLSETYFADLSQA